MTAIEWTDATWNPTTGCDRVSPGCANCYALTLAARLKAMGQPRYQNDGDPKTSGPGFGLTLHPDKLDQPLRWRKPRMVFVNSMSDLFHEDVHDDFLRTAFAVMASTKHTFQVLTKRPERARDFFVAHHWRVGLLPWAAPSGQTQLLHTFPVPNDSEPGGIRIDHPPENIWIGTSIENARYTWRADVLREIPAAVRFISAEPLLGSLFEDRSSRGIPGRGNARLAAQSGESEMDSFPEPSRQRAPLDLTGIAWLIAGGESGPGYRPMQIEHARELRDACLESGTAFFFKQHGGQTPKSGGKTLDGREWCDYPVAA